MFRHRFEQQSCPFTVAQLALAGCVSRTGRLGPSVISQRRITRTGGPCEIRRRWRTTRTVRPIFLNCFTHCQALHFREIELRLTVFHRGRAGDILRQSRE